MAVLASVLIAVASVGSKPVEVSSTIKCVSEQKVRTIAVEYFDSAKEDIVCRVKYVKEVEKPGEIGYPYYANSDLPHCGNSANYLSERLTSYGWNCKGQVAVKEGTAAKTVK